MDVFAMTAFVIMGFEVMTEFGGYESFAQFVNKGGNVADSTERMYMFSAAAQRLIVWQLAYEIKNLCDSVLHNDGVVFLVHHTLTAVLALSKILSIDF